MTSRSIYTGIPQTSLYHAGWSVHFPLHMREVTQYYNMENYTEFYDSHPEVFIVMKNVLIIKGLKVDTNYSNSDILNVNGSSGPSGEGMYFRICQYKGLTEGQYNVIKSIFPIKNLPGGYSAMLHSISDFDYDEDRAWQPSVSFSFYKGGKNILNHSKKGFGQ